MSALYDMTLGLVAFGDIAREVALRAKPFGLKILAFDPIVDKKTADSYGVTMAGLSDVSQMAVRRRTVRNIANALIGEWPSTRDLLNPEVEQKFRPVPSAP